MVVMSVNIRISFRRLSQKSLLVFPIAIAREFINFSLSIFLISEELLRT